MPLDPKQLRVLKALCTHLEAINPTNLDPGNPDDEDYVPAPYDVDLRDKAFRGKTVFGNDTLPPFLSLLESPQPGMVDAVGFAKTTRREFWSILLQGFVIDDPVNPTDPAYLLKAQVEQRLSRLIATNAEDDPLFPNEYLLGKLIISLTIGQGVVRPPDEKVSSKAFFYIPLVIEMKTDTSNPYAD